MLSTFRILAELPPDSLGAYVISMAHTASDVLAVVLLQVIPQPLVAQCIYSSIIPCIACGIALTHFLQGKRCSTSMLRGDAFVSFVLSLAMRGAQLYCLC